MEERKEDQRDPDEKVVEIEIERLRDFKNHPFKVQADSQMKELQESIKKYGILNPLIVRPRPEGFYEIISGHRRKYAAQQLKYTKVPVIIRYMLEEDAIISMVDANLQRERISPSEKAFAYKMKYDVLKRKAGRRKCSQVDYLTGKKSVEVISEECGDSPKQVQRYLKLVVQDQVWGRVTENRSQGKSTRYYMDEMHLLLREEQTAAYTVEIWKRFRKWGGIPTGITQNVKVRPDRALCKAV